MVARIAQAVSVVGALWTKYWAEIQAEVKEAMSIVIQADLVEHIIGSASASIALLHS